MLTLLKNLIIVLKGPEKNLGITEDFSTYKSKLIAERGRLYGLLHNPAKQKTTTLTKEEIIQQMADIGEKLKPVYNYENTRRRFPIF